MSTRTKEIIQIVVAEHGYITIKDIAGKMNISERTVYREIPEITDVLSEYDITLETVSKKGIKIVGDEEKVQKLLSKLNTGVHVQIVDPKERMFYIIMQLLHEEEFIKTEALAIDLETSLPTIRNDLKKIGKLVPEYNLELVQKKGEGICLSGNQVSKDHLLVNLLMQNIEIAVFLRWLEGDLDKSHPFLSKLSEYGYKDIFQKCHRLIQDLQEQFSQNELYFEDQSYLEFITLTALMIRRHDHVKEQGELRFLSKKAEKTNQRIADKIVRIIESGFAIQLEEQEVEYILWLISICISSHSNKGILEVNFMLRPKIQEFVEKVEDRMGIYLSQDEKLMDGLLTHMDKALKRIRSGMCISNPIIREIEKDYKQLFSIIKQSVYEVFPNDFFPDDEIGYLVLYFAVSLDNITKKTFRILVVCSSGMGSSKMLASRLEREIPEIYVRKIVSLIGLGSEDLNDYDLILSTIPLYLDSDTYLKVSPLLNKQELELVKEKIRRHKHKTLKKIEEREKNSRRWDSMDGINVLTQLNLFTQYSTQLLKDFRILRIKEENITREMVSDEIIDWAGEIGISITKNELKSYHKNKPEMEHYFVIPATEVGYFECFMNSITKPALAICYFEEQEVINCGISESVRAVTILLYPKKMDIIQREFIGCITDLIIEDANIIEMIEKGDQEGIKRCLSFRFLEYLKDMV